MIDSSHSGRFKFRSSNSKPIALSIVQCIPSTQANQINSFCHFPPTWGKVTLPFKRVIKEQCTLLIYVFLIFLLWDSTFCIWHLILYFYDAYWSLILLTLDTALILLVMLYFMFNFICPLYSKLCKSLFHFSPTPQKSLDYYRSPVYSG